jgi:uncharacterized protein (DUF2235 family)
MLVSPERVPQTQGLRQNLLVCCDGTWNDRDDSTNVSSLHDFAWNSQIYGPIEEGGNRIWQLKYYDTGVGTGLLDSISGGAFGHGLEENVREAYDWLVENYVPGDRIFVVGFSRGAFTARSLLGLIGKFGCSNGVRRFRSTSFGAPTEASATKGARQTGGSGFLGKNRRRWRR